MKETDKLISENFVPKQTCSVELDEWLKRMKSKKSAHDRYHPDIRRDPRRYGRVLEDS